MPRVQRSVWAGSSTGPWQPRVGSPESRRRGLPGGRVGAAAHRVSRLGGGARARWGRGRSQGGAAGRARGWVGLNCRRGACGSPRGRRSGCAPGGPCPLWCDGGGRSRWPGVAGSHGEGRGSPRAEGWAGVTAGRAPGPGMRGGLERMGSRVGAGPGSVAPGGPPFAPAGWAGGCCGGALRAASRGRTVASVAPPGGPRTPGPRLRRGLSAAARAQRRASPSSTKNASASQLWDLGLWLHIC